ncbi:MAG TPA: L,D-transpeptidase family protein [Jatrophihabitans sp.]|jgi:L,D-peptidoglycan transpeptidase YkuD (ErfK/YbiS/YcfS/YnhG family)|uniref:L,D-transpeptidase family protein n=1 Tax=Jatrophihabitans sp. TaxID=1932789 RepID=UPI002DFE5FC2|nr:L,D-transpeptidase family protein [Jatrophihabitans sp.]
MDRRRWGIVALAGIVLTLSACGSDTRTRGTASVSATPSASTVARSTPTPTPTVRPTTSAPRQASRKASRKATPTVTTPHPRTSTAVTEPRRAVASGQSLPLDLPTDGAAQVITVTADSSSSTTGNLQAWRRVSGGWRRVGPSVFAHLGADGVGPAGESTSRTPAGSFTLTQAFGHDSDPGTRLPYRHTTPADWWISEPGPLYNTHQICSSGCGFNHGDPNEHLYYETPYYNYAVVIDYNTTNAPGGVRAGAGSAFFLHVTVGQPTAGCVSVPQDDLVRIMQWLDLASHPRILIGVT